MSANVVDFENERAKAQQKRAKALRRRAEAAQRTLDEASDIREALRKTARTENHDRAIFAANLARMCKEATRDDKTSIREIFKTAFDQGFDAKYKKLKRFVCAQHDDPPNEGFAAHGADFVALAESVATIAQEGRPSDAIAQAKNRSVLQLIEGSSFDKKRTPEVRRRDESVAVLLDWMDQVLRNIETEVDLDAMYDAIEHASAAAVFDADGNVSRLAGTTKEWSFETIRNFGESTEDFEARSAAFRFSLLHPTQQHLYKVLHDRTALDPEYGNDRVASQLLRTVGPNDVPLSVGAWDLTDPDAPELTREAAYAPFAPRAVLGHVLSPVKRDFEELGVTGAVAGVVMLDIDEREIGGALSQQAQEYQKAVNRFGLAGIVPAFNQDGAYRDLLHKAAVKALAARIGFSERWISEECATFDDLAWQFSREERSRKDLQDLWSTEPEVDIVTRRQIELKLLRDMATRNWRLNLALSRGMPDNFSGREGVYGVKRQGKAFEPSFALGYHHDSMPGPEICSFFLHRVADNRFMMYGVFGAGGEFDSEWGESGPEDPVFGIEAGWLPLPSASALDALFAPIERTQFGSHGIGTHTIDVSLNEYEGEYAPAKQNTLAGMILRNHAYAGHERRYGALLLEDARRKAAMARDFIEQRKREFDAGMQRPWATGGGE